MKYTVRQVFAVIAILFALGGCGSSSSSPIHGIVNDNKTFSENEKSFLYHDLFLNEYYWYMEVHQPFDYSGYTDRQKMINDLKYDEKDRWSFVMTREEYDNFASQKTTGFGFGYTPDFDIYMVRIDSPADKAGLLRGDRIVEIDGKPVTKELIVQAHDRINQPTVFTIEREGAPKKITVTSREYSFKVSEARILDHGIGYFRFDAFTDNATDEIEQAFSFFALKGVKKLVVDLRYNGGGYLNTASILLDKLSRDNDGEIQFTQAWNDKNIGKNETATFETDENSIDLEEIIFLTTKHSASASELVINALKPYLGDNVVLVGERTHGKPVGMAGRVYGSHIYFLINFVVENADGFYDYFDGLPVDCPAEDDLTHQLGDPQEAMLKEALDYIETGSC